MGNPKDLLAKQMVDNQVINVHGEQQVTYKPDPFMDQRYAMGNIDLLKRPRVKMPGGGVATIYSMTATDKDKDGKEYAVLIPGVRFGLDRPMTGKEAFEHYKNTGEHLGKFPASDGNVDMAIARANGYAEYLHQMQAKLIGKDNG